MRVRRSTGRRMVGAAIVLSVAAGCAAVPPPSGSAPPAAAAATPTTSADQPGSPAASATVLVIADLPQASLEPAAVTAICDPEASQVDAAYGFATLSCPDGLRVAARVFRATAVGPLTRLYFRRPACPAVPCTDDQLSTATITAWTDQGAYTIALDSRLLTVALPIEDPTPVWPSPANASEPASVAPTIAGAPSVIANRVAHPYCGHTTLGQPPDVSSCFRDAVLAGRPAEMIETVFGTEGGEVTWLDRFDGHGAVLRFSQFMSEPWRRQAGTLILGIGPQTWDFDPWGGTDVALE